MNTATKRALLHSTLFMLALSTSVQAGQEEYKTAYDYTMRFYPRWFTWTQSSLGKANRLSGPIEVGTDYKIVVAINDDTIYAQSFLDLSTGPQILTVPPYPYVYSILIVDVFGNIITSVSSPTSTGATYGLVGPNDTETLPADITPVKLPYNTAVLIFRIDKYSPQNENHIEEALQFRAALQMQGLQAYQADPTGGKTSLNPSIIYSPPLKRMAGDAIQTSPTSFLNTLQTAMASSTTEPLNDSDNALISQFNTLFDAAKQQNTDPAGSALSDITQGVQAAYAALIDRWRSHKGATNWIHFDNIGEWGTNYLDRAALTEYIQFGNNHSAAYYAQAFEDSNNIPLDGSQYAYTITFPKDNLPEFNRFASLTAYTPVDNSLVANSLNKYVVASYTPELVTNPDGSVTIYVQSTEPTRAPLANWLPIPDGPFNLMLRLYGPQGKALNGSYLPPTIQWGLPY